MGSRRLERAGVVPGESLVVRARSGDTRARDALIAAHLPLIYDVVGRALPGSPDVDDVVRKTVLQAIRGLPGLREPAFFRSWLMTVAYREIRLHRRRPASEVTEQRRVVARAARWLDDDDRCLLALWWRETVGELSRAELAGAMRVGPKRAAVRVERMKQQLDTARAVVGALRAEPRCPELAARARRRDGVAGPLLRKRLIRHVRACPSCSAYGVGLVPAERLLPGMAMPPLVVAGVRTSRRPRPYGS